MKKFKLGVGPMSREIIQVINDYSEHNPLMVVASRNQSDYDGGYVCSTSELSNLLEIDVFLCRDHCGPYFSDADQRRTLSENLQECKKTIREDIRVGFDLIHIDVSRIEHHRLEYATELIEYALECDPKILLEFGSEDNTGEDLEQCLRGIDEQLKFIEKYKENVKFFVTQTGSLTQHMQMGTFDIDLNTSIVNRVHEAGFRFKEHNADYLNKDEVSKRTLVGVDAMNIAPQLGAIQTQILKELSNNNKEWYEFSKRVIDSNSWIKWLPHGITDAELKVIVAGHYHFNTIEYKRLLNTIDQTQLQILLKESLYNIFDCYTK